MGVVTIKPLEQNKNTSKALPQAWRDMPFNPKPFFLILLFAMAALELQARGDIVGEPADLAILSSSPALEVLLVAALKEYIVAERADLDRVAWEKLLAGGELRLLGSRRILVLEGEPPSISGRLVDAVTGATILELRPPTMPEDQLAKWVQQRLANSLRSDADGQARRFSLLGLRFDLDSAANRNLERRVNLSLASALHEGGAMVLERWRLGDLVFEKQMLQKEGPFWEGAILLDGSLSHTEARLSARIRLRHPDGTEEYFELTDDSPEALVSAVVEKALGGREFTELANVEERTGFPEAEAFLKEAGWLLDHGLPLDAWQSAESAIALGAQGVGPEMARIKAAAMVAYPDDLRSSHGQDGGYRDGAFPENELPFRVRSATEMSLMAGDFIIKHHTDKRAEWWTLEHPATLGVYSLYTGLRVLRTAHDTGWFLNHPNETLDLRVALRRQIQLLESLPLHNLRSVFFTYLTIYAGYWNETPEEAVRFYRRVLRPDFDAGLAAWPKVVREELGYGNSPHPPFLAGEGCKDEFPIGTGSWRIAAWNGAEPLSTWRDFLKNLSASENPLEQADALALRWQSTASQAERLKLTADMVNYLLANLSTMQGSMGPAIFAGFLSALRDVNAKPDLAPVQEGLVDFFLVLLNSPSPLPPEILPKVWCAFTDSRVNAREDQAESLRKAISQRTARVAADKGELRELKAATAALDANFGPTKAEFSVGDVIPALGPWIKTEHLPESLRWQVGFHSEAAVWYQNMLWVLDPHEGKLGATVSNGAFWTAELASHPQN